MIRCIETEQIVGGRRRRGYAIKDIRGAVAAGVPVSEFLADVHGGWIPKDPKTLKHPGTKETMDIEEAFEVGVVTKVKPCLI